MTDIIIAEECNTAPRIGGIYFIEPTYRDNGDGTVVMGQYQTKYDLQGNLVEFGHFESDRARWQ